MLIFLLFRILTLIILSRLKYRKNYYGNQKFNSTFVLYNMNIRSSITNPNKIDRLNPEFLKYKMCI